MNQLPWWMEIPVILLGVFAGRFYGGQLHARGVELAKLQRVRDVPLLPLSIFGFVAAVSAHSITLGNPYWSWYLPVLVEFYIQPAMWALQIFFLFFCMVTVTKLASYSSRFSTMVMVVFTISVFFGVETLLRVHSSPAMVNDPPLIRDGVITQTTDATCAAATGANVAARLGIQTTEAEMAAAMNTNRYGTTPSQIIHGMKTLGLDARKVKVTPNAVTSLEPPAVLLVNNTDQIDGHAVALMGVQNGVAEIWDPLNGKVHYTAEAFADRWVGHAIVVSDGRT